MTENFIFVSRGDVINHVLQHGRVLFICTPAKVGPNQAPVLVFNCSQTADIQNDMLQVTAVSLQRRHPRRTTFQCLFLLQVITQLFLPQEKKKKTKKTLIQENLASEYFPCMQMNVITWY